ncbi:hypothetical protein [Pseudomonas sp. KNUC1026]|uniref:hypothetical protein n=1 Tax=Pseudomonas sp. KNUC1026 TaxID=2893890 RepID=UPI001F162756|nr:hypothetical protein [Pseudomonas sp. KNUC1026]UFH50062.1 hypothetical protein LN139_01435 [Pseudomonas sp. KNUC1026]
MPLHHLRRNVNEHHRRFIQAPFLRAWKEKDFRVCLRWFFFWLPSLGYLMQQNDGSPWIRLSALFVSALFSTLCAIRIQQIYARLRLKHPVPAGQDAYRTVLAVQQQWFCRRYQCTPRELGARCMELFNRWQEQSAMQRKTGYSAIETRMQHFFSLPDTTRLMTWLLGILTMMAAMLTLGSSIDAVFEAIGQWKFITLVTITGTLLCFEVTLLVLVLGQLLRHLGDLWWLSKRPALTDQRVYRYLNRMLAASNLSPRNTWAMRPFDRFQEKLFEPVGR